jgi:hypothetical protein
VVGLFSTSNTPILDIRGSAGGLGWCSVHWDGQAKFANWSPFKRFKCQPNSVRGLRGGEEKEEEFVGRSLHVTEIIYITYDDV